MMRPDIIRALLAAERQRAADVFEAQREADETVIRERETFEACWRATGNSMVDIFTRKGKT